MDWAEWEVIHVVQRPVWIMPMFLPRNPQNEGLQEDDKV
jgi:hypothetical protein